MTAKLLLEYSMIADILVAFGTLVVMWRRRAAGTFSFLAAYLAVFLVQSVVAVAIMFFRKSLGIERNLAFDIYFYSHWTCFVVKHVLLMFVIYKVFSSAIKPLQGLHKAGNLIFRWVSVVAVVLSIAAATGPNLLSAHYFANVAGQVQQGISVLTLCLLLFVCFAIRYLGLTYRSHIFGVSLGLGVLATSSLVQSAFLSTTTAQSLYSPLYLFGALGSLVALGIWCGYFAMPEPARQLVLLPTTSPYFTWNRISEALGDAPGSVAVSGFKPDMLSAGELQMMTAAAKETREQEIKQRTAELPSLAMQR